jgi:hypothetical protein
MQHMEWKISLYGFDLLSLCRAHQSSATLSAAPGNPLLISERQGQSVRAWTWSGANFLKFNQDLKQNPANAAVLKKEHEDAN